MSPSSLKAKMYQSHNQEFKNILSIHTSDVNSEDDEIMLKEHLQYQTQDLSNKITRRVRSRSLIDDDQLAVLKSYYAINPRPKKEDIIMIANYVNFPIRVVQVRFNNLIFSACTTTVSFFEK